MRKSRQIATRCVPSGSSSSWFIAQNAACPRPCVRPKGETTAVPRSYTIREAAEISTKSYSALRGMVDRGQLEVTGGGKSGRTRRIKHDELKRAGILRVEEVLAESAVQELSLRLSGLSAELQDVEARLSQHLARIEVLLAEPKDRKAQSASDDDKPELRAA
jgi:hypothetical protein